MRTCERLQVVITSYDMLKRLSCKSCLDGSKPGSVCAGPEICMAAKGFKVCICPFVRCLPCDQPSLHALPVILPMSMAADTPELWHCIVHDPLMALEPTSVCLMKGQLRIGLRPAPASVKLCKGGRL